MSAMLLALGLQPCAISWALHYVKPSDCQLLESSGIDGVRTRDMVPESLLL